MAAAVLPAHVEQPQHLIAPAQAAFHIAPSNGQPDRWVSLADLRQLFHLTQQEAAAQLGIGLTSFKQFAKQFGIKRWPSRIISRVLTLIGQLQGFQGNGDQQAAAHLITQAQQLEADIRLNPNMDFTQRIQGLRAAVFRLESRLKRQLQRMRPRTPPPACAPQRARMD